MKILYLDCFSGASGDMILGALLDMGVPEEVVRNALDTLGLDDWRLTVESVERSSIRATRAKVETIQPSESRTYSDISELLSSSTLEEGIKTRALRIFTGLAEAEGRVHGVPPWEVHFHEVGSTDAIVDIVGCSAALAHLGPAKVVCSPLPSGGGIVTTQHGDLPVPVPAVTELLQGVPIYGAGATELVTPTGAAILTATVDEWGPIPAMTLEATGYGAGTRILDPPNVLRVMVGIATDVGRLTDSLLVETNIDDMAPELLPYVVDQLLAAGAQDAWVTPISMKKGRAAQSLSVLVHPDDKDRVIDVLFRETTTFGVRLTPATREILERRWVQVSVAGHGMRVKLGIRGGSTVTFSPEHDDAVEVARATGLALREVYFLATNQARNMVDEHITETPS